MIFRRVLREGTEYGIFEESRIGLRGVRVGVWNGQVRQLEGRSGLPSRDCRGYLGALLFWSSVRASKQTTHTYMQHFYFLYIASCINVLVERVVILTQEEISAIPVSVPFSLRELFLLLPFPFPF